jgi:hypothetical protein
MDGIIDDYAMAPLSRWLPTPCAMSTDGTRMWCLGVRRAGQELCVAEPLAAGREWAANDAFSIADCAAAPALFYAHWGHRFLQPTRRCGSIGAFTRSPVDSASRRRGKAVGETSLSNSTLPTDAGPREKLPAMPAQLKVCPSRSALADLEAIYSVQGCSIARGCSAVYRRSGSRGALPPAPRAATTRPN